MPSEAERIAARHAGFSAISAESYPLSAAATGTMAGYISTEQFIWGLHKVLDGLVVSDPGAEIVSGAVDHSVS
ncbi:hypothetical protein [Arthrobacter sp. ISL-5]|uniref:hypothetical protein n=1 Tax=Arthrobacter sp. ISL-5 TaxID=2819111 RepID=UPI001BE9B2F5|nr:hypothetical protein [Arthrobacter sp. ISL-5]MBT2555481.1 hypothetical protein [Arthrobacter sp. ISL-5]